MLRGRELHSRSLIAWAALFLLAGLTLQSAGADAAGRTLEAVRARGHLLCGVGGDTPGFASVDSRGQWSGLMVDYCQAMAAATLGSKDAVKFIALSDSDRFQALASGTVDVLVPASAWTLSRDSELGLLSAGVLFFDGQGFLVHRGDAVTSVLELSGSTLCVQPGSAAESAVSDFFKSRQMKYQLVVSERWADLVKSYDTGGCKLLTGDVAQLAHERSRLSRPSDHVLLSEVVSIEPVGPLVRDDDASWLRIARWTLAALIEAEELNITAASAQRASDAATPDVRRFLGVDQNPAAGLGLAQDWAQKVIQSVGNYGELFERNIGLRSQLRLERGLNALWDKGGLMYAPPFR